MKEWEFKSIKILQDLNYENYDKIVEIKKIELKLERSGIFYYIIPKKYLHLVLQAENITKNYSMFNCSIYQYIALIMLFYQQHRSIFLKIFVDNV